MKFLASIFSIMFLILLFLADVKINNHIVTDIVHRIVPCMIASIIFTLIIGLPILGIISLFQ